MVKAMLEAATLYSQPIQILTLCFTNHALDQFLEELMDAGVPDTSFVRIGSSPKISDRLKPRCLRELEQGGGTFSVAQNRSYAILKSEQDKLERALEAQQRRLNRSTWGPAAAWWKSTVSEFLSNEHPEEWLELNDDPADGGFTAVAEPGTRWNLWCFGKSKSKGDEASEGLWALNKQARLELRETWNQEWRQLYLGKQLVDIMDSMDLNARTMQQLRSSSDVAKLKVRRRNTCCCSELCACHLPLHFSAVTDFETLVVAEIQDHWLHHGGSRQAAQRAAGGGSDRGAGGGGWRDL